MARGEAGAACGVRVSDSDSSAISSSAAERRCVLAAARAVHRLNEEKPCLTQQPADMWRARRRLALDLAMAGWGLGAWLGVNGLYVQLPLLVQQQPERWKLPSAMVLAVQLANAGPLLYALLRRLGPRVPDSAYIYALLAGGAVALTLNAFLHPLTVPLPAGDSSLPFLALTFCTALVGCTSSVLFYPYMRHYPEAYLATYLAGEGLGGFVPSVLALLQGVGGEPACVPSADGDELVPVYPPARFGSGAFMLALAALAALSLGCFALVERWPAFAAERVRPAAAAKGEEAAPSEPVRGAHWASVLALMVALNALVNGALPSVQSYSCMPYGARAYHLAASLSAMANPAACLAGAWLALPGARALAALLVAAAAPLAYILATALLSPAPPLQHAPLGEALVVVSWVCVSAALSYARMWVYAWARRGGAGGMRACGAATQAGSAAGSLLLFLLVNYTALFVQPAPCPAT